MWYFLPPTDEPHLIDSADAGRETAMNTKHTSVNDLTMAKYNQDKERDEWDRQNKRETRRRKKKERSGKMRENGME